MEKEDPIAVWPPVTTRTGPVFGYGAAAGSVTVIVEAVQAEVVAAIPLNVTLPDEPRLEPAITMDVPDAPLVTLVPLMVR